MNKTIVQDAVVLFAFTVVLGLILGVVYGITKGPIDQVNYEKTQSAYKQVFEDADSFEEYADFDTAAAEDLMAQNGYSDDIEAVNTALDASGNPLGYVLTVRAVLHSLSASRMTVRSTVIPSQVFPRHRDLV